MPKLIGLTGKALAGKDSIGKVLCERHAYYRVAFADPLKDATAHLFGLPRNHFDDPAYKETRVAIWGLSPRQMMQLVGTDMVRRYLGPEFWTKRLFFDIKPLLGEENIVVTDVRFENEAEFVRQMGGTVVHVIRPGVGLAGETSSHESEQGVKLREHDMLISNDGTLEDLTNKVEAFLADFL